MKKVLLIVFACIATSLFAQNEDAPAIIKEIDKTSKDIDKAIQGQRPSSYLVTPYPGYFEKNFVWLRDNKISKITQFMNTSYRGVWYTEFYFDNNSIVLIRTETALKNPTYQHYEGIHTVTDTSGQLFYYSYNELVSKPELLISNGDTVFWYNVLLKQGYDLWEQYKNLQEYNPFTTLKYDKVVAYSYDGIKGQKIVENGKLSRSVKDKKELTKQQTDSLVLTITDTLSYGGGNMSCFSPHLGIVFYDGKKIAAHISICFECNLSDASIYLPAAYHHSRVDIGDDYYVKVPLHGFSTKGRRQLTKLCNQLGFDKCPSPTETTIWDPK